MITTQAACQAAAPDEPQRWLPDYRVRDGVTPPAQCLAPPPPHNHLLPSTPLEVPWARHWEQVKPIPAGGRGGGGGGNERAVSSSLCVSIGDLWTCFASLYLYVMIKYRLSAQLIPEAKGKSLCPHIICKPSPSLRTDLFTVRESVLYYPTVTPPCLSSLLNVRPSCCCLRSEYFLPHGGKKQNIFEW